jgi:competence protein ComEC
MLGIGATSYLGSTLSYWIILPAVLSLLAGILFRRRPLLFIGISLLSLLWGSVAVTPHIKPQFPADHISRKLSESPVVVVGVICQRPQLKERSTRIFLEAESVDGVKTTGRIMITVVGRDLSVMTGDRIKLATRLREPRNYGIPGEYDFRRFLALQEIFVTGYLADAAGLELLQEKARFPLQRSIDDSARWLCRFIDSSVQPPESGVLKALLVGERGYVSTEIEELYSRTGVNHILSISGFHLGIMAFVIYQLLALIAGQSDRLLLYNIRWKLMLATVPFIVSYLLISGCAPATVRSVLMFSACFLALLLERETDSVNMLALAALVILAVNPETLFDISFQLSFLALWGILVIAPFLMGWYPGVRTGIWFRIFQFCAVSAAAIAATLLPVAYSFHRVSLIGLLSNFVAVPLLGYGAVVAGFAALLLAPLMPLFSQPLLAFAALLVSLSNQVMFWLDRIPQLPRFTPSALEVAISVLVLAVFTLIKTGRNRLTACLVLVSLAVWVRFGDSTADKDKLKVMFLSVGHGDSTFIRFPDGSTMLVDAGGSLYEDGFDAGERLIAPALWSLGVDRIDRMVLSHPHPDHIKGLLFIARNFRVSEFWESGYAYESPAYLQLRAVLDSRGVIKRTINGSVSPFITGGAIIEPLAPPRPAASGKAIAYHDLDVNEESLVFRLVLGRFSLLLTGDAGLESEANLLTSRQKLQSTVLKVAHHGSRNSSSLPFLKAASPQLAVISSGYGNNFHLPAAETVADLKKQGSQVHRTDLDGSLELTVNPLTGSYNSRKYPPVRIDTY